ncbi:hypothetical protein BCR44DRAFT_1430022 [Catenaria anguillulae PL171]|uniref:Uncharacterized protein n=1 Tax=Catenaria anguillulae PL171 TaxID=765915 RepID=A0A1Y2HTI6_9FUNG|nr:hypothetical protein BCR44DRAFT_1430022 [Catenaria anguillulae PL171]
MHPKTHTVELYINNFILLFFLVSALTSHPTRDPTHARIHPWWHPSLPCSAQIPPLALVLGHRRH